MLGVTLAGGGARGAYIAGVLRYIYTELPKKLGYKPWPDLVSGVSVGVINGYFIASHSDYEIQRMTELWTQVEIQKVYKLPVGPISFLRNLLLYTPCRLYFPLPRYLIMLFGIHNIIITPTP